MMSLDLDRAAETFAESSDFTVGVEEEFAILDPDTLDLAPRFEELRAAAESDPVLFEGITGELISSEIEIISGRARDLHDALAQTARAPPAPVRARRAHGAALGSHRHAPVGRLPRAADHRHRALPPRRGRPAATSPGATTPSACTCTSACATSTARCASATGCAGCCRCCSRCPPTRRTSTGATAACSPRARRASPRASRAAASPTRSAAGRAYREYIEFLMRTSSIVEFTQVWWSVRPHFSFGTVEVRICDVQATAQESDALAALMVACIAQATRDVDEGVPFEDPAPRADRGEHVARDPLRPRRQADRPASARRSTRRAR